MNKPTPTKLVLLMSAAGLGLSWSGTALASRESDALPALSLPTNPALRDEKGCQFGTADGWVSCSIPEAELQRTLVATATSLVPLPAPVSSPGGNPAATHAWQADRREVPSPARAEDGAAAGGALDALAWVTMDDPRQLLAPPKAAASAETPAPARPQRPNAVISESDRARASATAQASDNAQAPVERTARVAVAPSQPSVAATAAAPEAGPALAVDRRAADASAAKGLSDAEWASIDRVLASLVDVVGSQLEDPPAVAASHAGQPAAPVAVPAAAIVVPVERAGQAAPAAADSGHRMARAADADDIVVSTHNDKVLMSLAALRSDKASDVGGALAAPEEKGKASKTVVVRHSDKVLQTLALFQCSRDELARGCAAEPESELPSTLSAPNAWEPFEPAPESAVASLGLGLGVELDIDLDQLALPAAPPDRAAHAQADAPAEPSFAAAHERSVLGGELVALNRDKLDEVRGGFVTDGGLKISFGIERAVYLNGSLVTTTSLNIADLSKIAGGQAQVSGNGAGTLGLLQSGTGNVFAPGSFSSTAAGTIIQNTLDNQKIKTITTIDAVVNSSGILRAINLQSSMRSAIVDSLRR